MPRKGSGKPPRPSASVRALLDALAAHPAFFVGWNSRGQLTLKDGHGLTVDMRVTRQQLGTAQARGWIVARESGNHWTLSDAGRRVLADLAAEDLAAQEGGQ